MPSTSGMFSNQSSLTDELLGLGGSEGSVLLQDGWVSQAHLQVGLALQLYKRVLLDISCDGWWWLKVHQH